MTKERYAQWQRGWRANRIAAGNCGCCGKPRQALAWLCDRCAAMHAERQRIEYRNKKRSAA